MKDYQRDREHFRAVLDAMRRPADDEDQAVSEPDSRTFHGLNGERVTVEPDEDGIDLRTSFPRMKLSPAGARDLAAHLIACARQADNWLAAAAADSYEPVPERCTTCDEIPGTTPGCEECTEWRIESGTDVSEPEPEPGQ